MQRSEHKKSYAVIGYGRFGKLWAKILSSLGEVYAYDENPLSMSDPETGVKFVNLKTALSRDVIFLCVPISKLQEFLCDNASEVSPHATVIDVASVKEMPVKWMDECLPGVKHLGIHPLFGPDSFQTNQINLIVLTPSEQYPELAREWAAVFESQSFFTKIISPAEHDANIAYSQGLTHFVGNILAEMRLPKTHTPTLGYNMLRDVERFCSNDTHQLFHDMLHFNTRSAEMFKHFIEATHKVSSNIRSRNSRDGQFISVGVMGDEGSFSHEAGMKWLKEEQIANGHIEFLTTAEKVYAALEYGSIQVGLLPIQNAAGGVVLETVRGLADHQCKISGFFPFLVEQCLIGRKDVKTLTPTSIHSHPQALRQCRDYLEKYYPGVPLIEEKDTALAAGKLSDGIVPEDSYIIAPKSCVDVYGLKLIEAGIQDLDYNITDFITVTGI